MSRAVRGLAVVPLVCGLVVLGAGGEARADDVTCESVTADTVTGPSDTVSRPLQLMDAARAVADVARVAPAGPAVRVAVVDSGILDDPALPVVERHSVTALGELRYFHGTAVAGLIAGRPRPGGLAVGVDPGAELVDVRVYDEKEPRDTLAVAVEPARVAAGLSWVAANARRLRIGVVNVSLALPDTPELAAAVRRLRAADVLVVAASGNRPRQEGDAFFGRFSVPRGDEDAGDTVFPAGYPRVLAVSATSADPTVDDRDSVLQSSAIDIAAPTVGAVTVALNGRPCVLTEVATSWATALVSGSAALLRARFPDESADQIAARLVATAGGSPTARSPLLGAGLVQPFEALTRPLHPERDGALPALEQQGRERVAASAPVVPPDPMPALRHRAWIWALSAGSVLLLAVLARPLLARRRSR